MYNKIRTIIITSNITASAFYFLHRVYLNYLKGHKIKRKSKISKSSILEGHNGIGFNSHFISSKIGFASYISENSKFYNTKIGKYCSIGAEVLIIRGNHPSSTFVSTHPAFFSLRKHTGFTFSKEQIFDEFPKPIEEGEPYTTIIGNDVWIGTRVSILDGVQIGDGAIIAAGSLVNKDVPPYAIYGGVPARLIKYRFDKEQIEFLAELKWWDRPMKWLKQHQQEFISIDKLTKSIKEQ